jgi:LacI family transcriptional regulator
MIAGPSQYSLSGWRITGWQRAMAEAGLSANGLLEVGDFGYESGARAAEALLARNPDLTAIIASNDQMALAALEVARARGLAVPDDLSLISFDNTPIVRFTQPPLTAVDQPIAETVSRAVEQLIARAPEVEDQGVIEVAAGLVERASTAPPPARA